MMLESTWIDEKTCALFLRLSTYNFGPYSSFTECARNGSIILWHLRRYVSSTELNIIPSEDEVQVTTSLSATFFKVYR